MIEKAYKINNEKLIEFLARDKNLRDVLKHPAANVFLSKIEELFYSNNEVDFSYNDNEIKSIKENIVGERRFVEIAKIYFEKNEFGEAVPIIQKEYFEYTLSGVLENYSIESISAEFKDENMLINTVKGSNVSSKDNDVVRGSKRVESFDSDGIEKVSRSSTSEIVNPVSLMNGQNIALDGVRQQGVKIGTIDAYSRLAETTGYAVTDHYESATSRVALDVVSHHVVYSDGTSSMEYHLLRDGYLQTFGRFDVVSKVSPISKQEIDKIIAMESIPSVRKGLEKYIANRETLMIDNSTKTR